MFLTVILFLAVFQKKHGFLVLKHRFLFVSYATLDLTLDPWNQDFNGASARRFRPSSSTRESLAMAVAERKAAMVKHKEGAKQRWSSVPGIFWKKAW